MVLRVDPGTRAVYPEPDWFAHKASKPGKSNVA